MSLAWLLTLAGLHFTAVSLLRSEEQFEVVINPLDTPVDEGNPVLLDCKANGPLTKCTWSNQKYSVRPGVTPGYELVGDFQNGYCSMLIKKTVFRHDFGRWRCHVTADNTSANSSSEEALLDVYVPPEEVTILANMPELYYKDQLMLYAGNETSKLLTCQAKGSNPPASVTWLIDWDFIRGNTEILSDTRHKFTVETSPNLTITTEYHKRNLTCQVTHPSWNNHVRRIRITLIVRHATSWVEVSHPLERYVHFGESTTLQCNCNGFPNPIITWYKKNLSSGAWEEIGRKPLLHLGLSLADHGFYRCSAHNFLNAEPLFSSEASIKVMYPTGEVSVLTPTYLLVSPGETIHLCCTADGFPEPHITWHKEQAGELWLPAAIGNNFTIFNVSVDDRGQYRCVAVNTLNSKEVVASAKVRLEIIGYEALLSKNTSSSLSWSSATRNLYFFLLMCYLFNGRNELSTR